jgi:hypothetical protein
MHYLVENALYKNHWLWFHIIAGGVIAKALTLFGVGAQLTLIIVGILAVAWEIYEWFTHRLDDKRRAIVDAWADIAGAWLMALVVVV